MPKHYDFILAGGGLAGLSLACHLANSPLRDRSILIVDPDTKERNDRTNLDGSIHRRRES
jgi:lycopene beta-cyclase